MWEQLAAKQHRFIGGTLQDLDETCGAAPETEIVSMSFDGTMFVVKGKDYDCSINREYAGLRAVDGAFEVSATGLPGVGFMFRASKEKTVA